MFQNQSQYNSSYKSVGIKKPRKWPFVLFIIFLILFGTGWYAYTWLKNLNPEDIFKSDFVRKQVVDKLGEEKAELFNLIPDLLGFTEKKTYLILFLNNTEIRPGGGFIGTYVTLEIDKGKINILKIEGTESLDKNTPKDWNPKPLPILEKHLHVDKWYFRDSNWSPDFPTSAEKSLELYKGEGGVSAEKIDGVVAFTTTFLEELLEVTGPFTVQGITFEPETAIEKLEYEVEYGYKDRGISFADRKQIIKPFMMSIIDHLKDNLFKNFKDYEKVIDKSIKEKHLFIYSQNNDFQEKINKYGLSGKIQKTDDDYLLWVDANLAALKTDHAMKRTLLYSISKRPPAHKSEKFRYLAAAKMEYTNTGKFDWRTTRYRTYARIFVPLGSKLVTTIGSMRWDRTDDIGTVDQGVENGKQWFGTFIAIEPGETKSLEFIYELPDRIIKKIEDGKYNLYIQKQLGTIDNGLTLSLNFDKTITGAKPAEDEKEWHDSVYKYETDLRMDREFRINF